MVHSKISIKDGVFSRFYKGRIINTSEPQDWIIVGVAPKIQRVWYKESYKDGNTTAPTCWSNDGKKPDADVENAPSNLCMSCSNDIKGSGGGNSKACKHSLRLAVLLPEELNGDLYRVILSSTSIFGKNKVGKYPYNAYTEYLTQYELSVAHVVTQAFFEFENGRPKVLFKPVRAITPEEYKVVSQRSEGSSEITRLKIVKDPDFSTIT